MNEKNLSEEEMERIEKRCLTLSAFRNPDCSAFAKKRSLYVLLGIFAGVFGLHNFYAGKWFFGLAELTVTILFLTRYVDWSYAAVCGIWVFIEILFVRRDGDGVRFN